MNFHFKFRILILNYEFWFQISNFDFVFWNLRWYEQQRRGISLFTENFVCCNQNAISFASKISRSFADDPRKILISKVDKFYTGLTMIIQKKIHFVIRCHQENIWVLQLRGLLLSKFSKNRFYYAELRRKLWPKAPAKEDALGQMSKNFQVYFIHINFFKGTFTF